MNAPIPARRHSTISVELGDHRGEIDEMIAPVIRQIWIAGIRTIMSCQEASPGVAWIEFDEFDGLVQFLNIVATFEKNADTVYDRVISHLCHPPPDGLWGFAVTPHDAGGYGEDVEQDGRLVD